MKMYNIFIATVVVAVISCILILMLVKGGDQTETSIKYLIKENYSNINDKYNNKDDGIEITVPKDNVIGGNFDGGQVYGLNLKISIGNDCSKANAGSACGERLISIENRAHAVGPNSKYKSKNAVGYIAMSTAERAGSDAARSGPVHEVQGSDSQISVFLECNGVDFKSSKVCVLRFSPECKPAVLVSINGILPQERMQSGWIKTNVDTAVSKMLGCNF